MQNSGENRLSYIDVLKVISAFLIVILHVSALYVDMDAKPSGELHCFLNMISRIGLPTFMMISGALLLRDQYRFDFKSKFLFVVKIYAFWSAFYVLFEQVAFYVSGSELLSIEGMIVHWIHGPYHFWYLAMLLGVYIFMPVLNRIKDFQTLNYLVALSFFLMYVLQPLQVYFPNCVNYFINQMLVYQPVQVLFFFMLGGWLHKLPLEKDLFRIANTLFIIGFLILLYQLQRLDHLSDLLIMTPLNNYSQLLMMVGFFYMIRYGCRNHRSSERLMLLSKCTLHIYILSAFFIYLYQFLLQSHWDAMLPILGVSILVWSVVVFACSFVAGYLVVLKNQWLKRRRMQKAAK